MTDPPFGVDNKSKQAVTNHGKEYARKIANDESPEIAIATFKQVMDVLLPKTRDNCDAYIFTSYQVLSDWLIMTDKFMGGFNYKRCGVLVWEKDGPGMGDVNLPWGMGMEFILWFRKGTMDKRTTRRNAVLHHQQIHPSKLIHPHEKPPSLLQDLMKASTDENDFVVDPFGGSHSLSRAARMIQRSAVSIELDEKNHELGVKAFTEGDGAGFDF